MGRSTTGVLLALFALGMLVLAWGEVFAPLEYTSFGIVLAPDSLGASVSDVHPRSTAERLGVRRGDVVDLSALSLSDRHRLVIDSSPIGTIISVPIVRGTTRRIAALRSESFTKSWIETNWSLLVQATITLLIVALIALLRPSLATAALVLYGAGAVTTYGVDAQFTWIPDPWFGAVSVFINALFGTLPLLALLPFIARFPQLPATPAARLRMHVADAVFICGAVLMFLQVIYEPMIFASWTAVDNGWGLIIAVVVLIFAMLSYRAASGEDRRRIGWVLVGYVVSVIGYAAFDTLDFYYGHTPSAFALLDAVQMLQSALPLALAYAILRHRVLDVGFFLNRTMVYAVVTTLAVVVVSLADWVTGRLLSSQKLALAVEAIVTISFGFALNWIHARTERVIDRVVFRERHIAEKRIEYRIGALGFASSSAVVDEALALDAPEILGLSSAAVFSSVSAPGPFERRSSTGWLAEMTVSVDDGSLLIRTLRSLERPVFLDDVAIVLSNVPLGAARPTLAIPIVAQHELIGFVLYGNHRDATSLDPEEVSLLTRLTAAAGNAYGAVEARRWRARAASLEESMRAMGSPQRTTAEFG
jgi:hypothetical protein